jgi:hypothetical protein
VIDCRCAECNTCFRDHGGFIHNWRGKPVDDKAKQNFLERGAVVFLATLLFSAVSALLLGVYALADLVF